MFPDVFHDALRDDPADFATRLVFADWLDDHGESDRAEFVRTQVWLDQANEGEEEPADEERLAELRARERQLRQEHEQSWLGPRPDSLKEWTFRGGFLDGLTFGADARLADLEPLLRRHPVRHLTLGHCPLLFELIASPLLGLIRSLEIGCFASSYHLRRRSDHLDRLFNSPYLTRVQSLSLHGDLVDNHFARVLTSTPALAGLRSLTLRSGRLSDAGLVQLLRPEAFRHLEEWHVTAPGANDLAFGGLFTPERAPRWRALTLWAAQASTASPREGLSRCTGLKRLELHWYTYPRLEGTPRRFVWLGGTRALRELCLRGNIHRPDVKELAACPSLKRLRKLHLAFQPLPAADDREWVLNTLTTSPNFDPTTTQMVL